MSDFRTLQNHVRQKPPFLENGEIYHIVLRGVADLPIFKNENDYYRAIFSLFEFNASKPIEIREQRRLRQLKLKLAGSQTSGIAAPRDLLVNILSFCFMPNHIHLLLQQTKEGGITRFMRKFGTGYAHYFNAKYKRKGHLFQGKFRAIHIKNDNQLRTVLTYIHANPVSLVEPGWKEKGIGNLKKVINFLENYKWSSYLDYLGKKNFPSVTKRDFLLELMNGSKGCRDAVSEWLEYKNELAENVIFLE